MCIFWHIGISPTLGNNSNNQSEPYIHGLYNFEFKWESFWDWIFYRLSGYKGFMKYGHVPIFKWESFWDWIFYRLSGYKGFMKYGHVPISEYIEMLSWLDENVSKRKYRNDILIGNSQEMGGIVHFKNKDDAVLFKLTWS